METYTLKLFYDGQQDFQEEEFQAITSTAAFYHAVNEAKKATASHFNINLGRIDREYADTKQRR
jgi:hypothetical protein